MNALAPSAPACPSGLVGVQMRGTLMVGLSAGGGRLGSDDVEDFGAGNCGRSSKGVLSVKLAGGVTKSHFSSS